MADPSDPLLDPNSDAGALTRLLLVETYAPSNPHYDREDSLKAMRLMRRVIENRLLSPARYGAPGATTDRDIVKLGNQFAGFRDYPILSAGLSAKLHSLLTLRAHGDERVTQFIDDAVTVATEVGVIPAYLQVTAWRTQNSSSPGSNFHFVASLQGNDFYETSPVPPVRQLHRTAGPYRHHHGRHTH